jgi:hypothetical protein
VSRIRAIALTVTLYRDRAGLAAGQMRPKPVDEEELTVIAALIDRIDEFEER